MENWPRKFFTWVGESTAYPEPLSAIDCGARSFAGSVGYDYEIYAIPAIPGVTARAPGSR